MKVKFNRATMLSALQWLAANPDNHIAGRLAENVTGETTGVLDEDAVCFCALGRYAKEAEIPVRLACELADYLGEDQEADTQFDDVWVENDCPIQNANDSQDPTKLEGAKRSAIINVGKMFNITEEEIFNVPA